MNNDMVSRRDFLKSCAQLSCAVGIIGVLNGCGSGEGEEVPPGSAAVPVAATANNDGSFTVAGAGKLKNGEVLYFTMPPENAAGVIFASDAAQNPQNKLRAFSTKCSHAGCAVKRETNGFRCPCHSSEFSDDGKPLSGPAKTPLIEYSVRVQGDDALIQLKS